MSCKHCLFQVPLETKENFEYRTIVYGDVLFIEEKIGNAYRTLYVDTIKKCPMCGDDLFDLNDITIFPDDRDATLQSLTERFGKEAVEKKLENFQEID